MLTGTLLIFITAFVALVAVIVALVVLLKDSESWTNRWLFIFLLMAGVWSTLVSFQDRFPDGYDVWLARTVFVAATGTCAVALAFSGSLVSRKFGMKIYDLLVAVLAMAACLVPGAVVVSFSIADQGVKVGYGPAYILVLLSIVYFLVKAVVTVTRLSRHGAAESKLQAKIILVGLSLGFISGILTNVVLPNVLHVSNSSKFAFIALILWSSFLVYAIVQYHFLDIRPVVARGVTYILSLTAVSAVYALIILAFTAAVFAKPDGLSGSFQIQHFLAVLLAAITFNPLKKFFNRLTNKFFFKDAYEPQVVLDKLATLLTETIDIDRMKRGAKDVLASALHPQFIRIDLLDDENDGSIDNQLMNFMKHTRNNILAANDISTKNSHIAELMRSSSIAILIALRTSKKTIGYMAVGYRQSGYAYSRQDINLLGIASDQIAIALQNGLQFQEIRGFNETLSEEVKDATSQLRDSNKKLRKLDEAKDEFISMASHQLRTPLTSVKGYISMALEGDGGKLNESQRKLLEEAFASAQRMVYLIGDFLNVSRLQTGKFVIEPKAVNLAQIITQELEQLKPTAARRNISLEYSPPANFPILYIDEDKIRQVIMNFTDNAIFYSKPGGKVQISLISTAGDVRLTVKDSGIGVPEAERHKLFAKFYRAENARKVRPDGTGIGLFMAKKVITAQGGSIIFESREGVGSTFGFSLPVSLTTAPKQAVPQPALANEHPQ